MIALLAVAGFAAIVLTRPPAKWLTHALPSNVKCSSGLDGSIWTGACAGLTVQGLALGDVLWTVHPADLLTGKLAAHVVLTNGPTTGRAEFEARSSKSLTLRNLVADVPLDAAVIPVVPRTLRGTAHLELTRVRLGKQAILQIEGHIEARDLVELSSGSTPLGSYSLTFPPGNALTGQLRDLDEAGPLSVEGTVHLTSQPQAGFTVEGLVAPRASATPALKQSLQVLGSPDAQGRRQFSMENSF